MTPAPAIRVLVVESDQADGLRLIQMLRAAGGRRFHLRRARTLSEAQRFLEGTGADVALLNLCLSDAQGLDVVSEAQRTAPSVPLVVINSQPDESLASGALRQGAQDFLIKDDLSEGQLARALRHAIVRQELHASLRSLSLNDELTGLYNRRGFITLAENRQKLAARQGVRSSLIFGDVDNLKQINDSFGHREGDRALHEVADVFRECFRESDITARIGGDEFCALLTDASESSEAVIRERLQRALESHNLRSNAAYRLSLSVGIVRISGPHGLEYQLARADAQMYEHKRKKRVRDTAATLLATPAGAPYGSRSESLRTGPRAGSTKGS